MSCSAQKEWGYSAHPPALLDVSPRLYKELATRRRPTTVLVIKQQRSYPIWVWSYQTCITIETVIDRHRVAPGDAARSGQGIAAICSKNYGQHLVAKK
jgi:hypothetical protein